MLNAIANDPDVGEAFFREVRSVLLEREIGEITVKAQSVIPGEKDWDKLPDLYMIMITTFDPFGEDGMIYTFENTCKEYPNVENKDGLKYIYFNTTGTKGGTESIKQLLYYLKHSKIENVTNEKVSHIHDYVETVKQSAEVRDRYMTIGEILDASKAEGLELGLERGIEQGRLENLFGILHDLGEAPPEIIERAAVLDADALKNWTKLAARAESMEEFLKQIN